LLLLTLQTDMSSNTNSCKKWCIETPFKLKPNKN